MDSKVEKEIKAKLAKKLNSFSPRPILSKQQLTIGDIRLIDNVRSSAMARYGMVVEMDPLREISRVALLSSFDSLATDRDFLFSARVARSIFSAAILSDLTFWIDNNQLASSGWVGSTCISCARKVNEQNYLDIGKHISLENTDLCLIRGNYQIALADNVWIMRNSESEAFVSLIEEVPEQELLARELRKLTSFETIADLSDQIGDLIKIDDLESLLTLSEPGLVLVRG